MQVRNKKYDILFNEVIEIIKPEILIQICSSFCKNKKSTILYYLILKCELILKEIKTDGLKRKI